MSVITDEVRTKVHEIVCDVLEIEPEELTEDTLFVEDLGADSMQAIEILASLEISFRTSIDQSQLERMINLKGLHEVLAESIGARS
ncbi:acyl carrier protein [Kitasatospora sp. NPDC048239]|uniref:acyl carrier protein n=1 Tax=Kitasatospora sp. NPDC048239 TaxID=3364046 RepID=UPI003715FD95